MGQVIISFGSDSFRSEVAEWTIQTNLSSSSAVTMDGDTTQLQPGVTGVLPVINGGTGSSSVDETPTSGSKKMVTSGGIYSALANKAASAHIHSASDITTGSLPVSRGGTGVETLTSGTALIGNGTNAVTTRSITNLSSKGAAAANTNLITGNSLVYHVQNMNNRTTAVSAADANYSTYMARGICASSNDCSSSLTNGCIYLQYK